MLRSFSSSFRYLLLALPLLAAMPAQAVTVNSYYGRYVAADKAPGKPATSLRGPVQEQWHFTDRAKRPYTIGVLFPHIKDSYWIAVNFGIAQRAAASGVAFDLLEAGGYPNLAIQIQQLKQLRNQGVDGVILGGIAYEKLDAEVAATTAAGIPVVAVINDILAPQVKAKSMVSFHDMGFKAGEHLRRIIVEPEVRVAFFPGPRDSGWAPESLAGFTDALADDPRITLLTPLWGDTGAKAQRSLILRAFHFYQDIDYLVGNAVMAQVAPATLAELGRSPDQTRILSTYLIPEVYEHIRAGRVAAAPADLNIDQGRIAMDMMIKLLDGQRSGVDFPFRAGPEIPVISSDNIEVYPFEQLFGDRGFAPVFTYRPTEMETEAR